MTKVPQCFQLSFVLMIWLVTGGCNYSLVHAPVNDSTESLSILSTVHFAQVQSQVIIPHCIRCQGLNSDNGDFTTYEKLRASSTQEGDDVLVPGMSSKSPLYTSLKNNGGNMPKRGNALTAAEAEMIKIWIDSGALKN